eukprot:TRINITY_DN5807_c0_g1_i2.p1 TRINITY_DN5807_c0_g1~~TRINITY_DN5807_c0_g1_i2.p1  ORF type:complete len:194 (-),score=28.55 TRINITY_DN5807_c0_g1_i2:215-796(-)
MPTSGYLLFCKSVKDDEKRKLEEEKGAKINVAELMKHLGQKWQDLAQEQKNAFVVQAKEQNNQNEDQEQGGGADGEQKGGLPISTVKKIVLSDTDIKRTTGECTQLMALLAEKFLAHLAKTSAEVTKRNKRTTIKAEDLKAAVRLEKRISNTGVIDALIDHGDFKTPKSASKDTVKSQSITKFMKPIPTNQQT